MQQWLWPLLTCLSQRLGAWCVVQVQHSCTMICRCATCCALCAVQQLWWHIHAWHQQRVRAGACVVRSGCSVQGCLFCTVASTSCVGSGGSPVQAVEHMAVQVHCTHACWGALAAVVGATNACCAAIRSLHMAWTFLGNSGWVNPVSGWVNRVAPCLLAEAVHCGRASPCCLFTPCCIWSGPLVFALAVCCRGAVSSTMCPAHLL